VTEFDPIYLTEEEHTALDHSGLPGAGGGAAVACVIYKDSAVGVSGSPMLTPDTNFRNDADPDIVAVDGVAAGQVNVLVDAVLAISVVGQVYGAGITAATVSLAVNQGAGVFAFDAEGAADLDAGEFDATVSLVWPFNAGDSFVIQQVAVGGNPSGAVRVAVTKIA
jgi:hypothetical protein